MSNDSDNENIYHNSILGQATLELKHVSKSEKEIVKLRQILLNVMREAIKGYDKVLFLDIPTHENKGDNAITIGELNVMSALNLSVTAYSCMFCDRSLIGYGLNESVPEETAVLAHGGGNLGAYPDADHARAMELEMVLKYPYILMAQSIYITSKGHLTDMKHMYNRHKQTTFLLRDLNSYHSSKRHFQKVRSILIPDMAFGIGPLQRYFSPSLDVLWINRDDWEKESVFQPSFPTGVTYLVSDWLNWETPTGVNLIDESYMKTHNGFMFLQRAKVLVTDRLHGHIMAALLNIPTVILDIPSGKISSLYYTWTKELKNVKIARDEADAVAKAIELLNLVNK